MFWMESYRILSRKVGVVAMLLGLFLSFYMAMGNTIWGEGVIAQGRIYYGAQAIAKDREIAAEFTGPLTEETVQAIWEKYGPPVNCARRNTTKEGMEAAAATGGNDNYCNRFVAEHFGEEVLGEDGQSTYVLTKNWTESDYLKGEYWFGYPGARAYWDRFMMAYVLAHIATIVLLCPVFSEDYAYRTADIILTTEKGRFTLWRQRVVMCCIWSSLCYWVASGSIFLQHIFCYGTECLRVSSGIAEVPMFFQWDYVPMGQALVILYLSGWFSALMVAVLTCAVSALCRRSFSALILSLAAYLGPFAFTRIVLDILPKGRVNVLLRYLCYSMPISYPGLFTEAPGNGRLVLASIAVAVGTAALALGALRYCRHQV